MSQTGKFEVGDRVKVIDQSGASEASHGEVVTVVGIEVSGSDGNMIKVRKSNGTVYGMLDFRFDFINSETPGEKMFKSEDVKKMVEEAVAAALGKVVQYQNTYFVPEGYVLVLRTSKAVDDMITGKRKVVSFYKNGFVWPEEFGAEVVCDEYVPSTMCGNGLHGLKWGYGDHSYLSRDENAVWQIIEVKEGDLVEIVGGKVKFSRGRLVYSGDLSGASKMLENHAPVIKENMDSIAAATTLNRRMYNQDFSRPVLLSDAYSNDGTVEVGLGAFSNLVGSQLKDSDLHAPALDIDVPHSLTPSSTPGHGHLFIDVPMPWKKYKKLLKVMGECGILEKGYVDASIRRKGSFLRLPWIKKVTTDRSSY